MNNDFITKEENNKIKKYSSENNFYLYEIGNLCGIADKGFWSKILNGIKPIPADARTKLNQIIQGG